MLIPQYFVITSIVSEIDFSLGQMLITGYDDDDDVDDDE